MKPANCSVCVCVCVYASVGVCMCVRAPSDLVSVSFLFFFSGIVFFLPLPQCLAAQKSCNMKMGQRKMFDKTWISKQVTN